MKDRFATEMLPAKDGARLCRRRSGAVDPVAGSAARSPYRRTPGDRTTKPDGIVVASTNLVLVRLAEEAVVPFAALKQPDSYAVAAALHDGAIAGPDVEHQCERKEVRLRCRTFAADRASSGLVRHIRNTAFQRRMR